MRTHLKSITFDVWTLIYLLIGFLIEKLLKTTNLNLNINIYLQQNT